MDLCLNSELPLAFVLTHLFNAQLSAGFSFESDAQLRAGLFWCAFIWPAGSHPESHRETVTTVENVPMVPLFMSQPVAWERSIGGSLPALAREQ